MLVFFSHFYYMIYDRDCRGFLLKEQVLRLWNWSSKSFELYGKYLEDIFQENESLVSLWLQAVQFTWKWFFSVHKGLCCRTEITTGKCLICKCTTHQAGCHYCQSCAYSKGICAMCGKKILDTKGLRQSQVWQQLRLLITVSYRVVYRRIDWINIAFIDC